MSEDAITSGITDDTIRMAEESIEYAASLVATVRATGGYKYRKMIHGSDVEIDKACSVAVPKLFEICIKLAIVEDMLTHDSYMDRTLGLYLKKYNDVVGILNARSAKVKP